MTVLIEIRVTELLAGRLCHDLISPISAIANGVELLSDEEPDFMRDALALVGDSTRKVSLRLQFYRFAFGFGRGGGISGAPPHELADGIFAGGRISCEYAGAVRALPLDWQKLGCNLLLIGAEALPRGGRVALGAGPSGLVVEATGDGAALSPEMRAAITRAVPAEELTSRTVQPYFADALAEALGCRLVVAAAPPGRARVETVSASPA